MIEDIIAEKEKIKARFFKTQLEKNIYLGEYKENVLIALQKENMLEGIIHPEIKQAISDKKAKLLKIRRDLPFKSIKPYIMEAERVALRYILVDDVSYQGDIVVVIVAKEGFNDENRDVLAKSPAHEYLEAGLSEAFYYAEGKRISQENYDLIKKKLPTHIDRFKILGLFDRILGRKCAVDSYKKK